jgi:hypothetical protein
MVTAVDRAVGQLSFTTRVHTLQEGNHDPRFWRYFQPLATSSNPVRAVDDDMKKSVINELDPKSYPETKGKWPVLRNKVRTTLAGINQHYAATGTLDGLARFVFGIGQDDSTPQIITNITQDTSISTPMPDLVTSLDTSSATPSEPIPGLVTSLEPSSTPQQAPVEDPSAGAESAAFKQSLDTPSTPADSSSDAASSAAKAAGSAAPAAARAATPAPRQQAPAARPTPAPAPSPSVWQSIASALATAAPAGAQIYSGVVAQDAQTQAARTLAAARAQAAASGGILGPGGLSLPSNIGTYALYAVIGVAGIGGLMLLINALKSKPSASPSAAPSK